MIWVISGEFWVWLRNVFGLSASVFVGLSGDGACIAFCEGGDCLGSFVEDEACEVNKCLEFRACGAFWFMGDCLVIGGWVAFW